MNTNLDYASIVRAFAQHGVDLSFQKEFDEESAVIGTMHTLVFTTRKPHRELSVYLTGLRVTLIVEDEGGIHRAMYGFESSREGSFETFVEGIAGIPEMIAALKGAAVVDTPIDWRGYK